MKRSSCSRIGPIMRGPRRSSGDTNSPTGALCCSARSSASWTSANSPSGSWRTGCPFAFRFNSTSTSGRPIGEEYEREAPAVGVGLRADSPRFVNEQGDGMKILRVIAKQGRVETEQAEVLVLTHFEGDTAFRDDASAVDRALDGRLRDLLRSGEFEGKPNETVLFHTQ